MLGSGINPESFKQDYSGFANAAATQAQGISDLGASIGGAIREFGKASEERKKIDAETKASRAGIESAIKLGDALGFDVKGMLSPVLERMDDPNTTPMESAALGREASTQIANVLNLGFKAQDQESERARLMQDTAYKNEQLRIAQQNANSRAQSAMAAGNAPPPTMDVPLGDGSTQKMQWNGGTQSYIPIQVSGLDGANQAVKGDDLIGLVKGFERFEPKAYNDYKQTSVGYGTKGKPGEVLTEEQASERLQSELFGHAKRIKDAAALKGITLNKNQFNALTSFDFNTGRGVNLIERFGDDPQQLASKILEYDKAGGEVQGGLVKRRQIEAALFLAPEEQAVGVPQPTSQNQGGIGFTPAKTAGSETYRPFTPEEIALYGSQGQVSSTGKVYPIRPPSGTEFTTNPDGSTTYRQGAGVGAKAEGVAKAQEQMKGESFRLNQANTEEAFGRLDVAGTNNPLFAAGNSLLAKALPASEVGELESFFERINGENSFIKMSQLRASSPTGGAAGTMTEKEWPRFEGRFSPLKANAKKDTLAKSLSLNLLNAFEATNGTPDDVIKALDEKKIDQATYDNYVNDYVNNRQIARVNANGVEGKSYDWTRLNKKLLSKSTIFEAPNVPIIGLSPEAQEARKIIRGQ